MASDNILKSIGLAARARKIIFGSDMTCEAVASGKVELVILCESAAANTTKRIKRYCDEYSVSCVILPIPPGELAHAVGKAKPIMSVGITDRNMSVLVSNSLLGLSESSCSSQTVSESEV